VLSLFYLLCFAICGAHIMSFQENIFVCLFSCFMLQILLAFTPFTRFARFSIPTDALQQNTIDKFSETPIYFPNLLCNG
jgi:hypothetical protein